MSTEQDAEDADGWDATRQRVLDRDGHACRFCGIDDDKHIDEYDRGLSAHHIVPKSDGGRDAPENLITVCKSCHRTLEATHAKAVAQLEPDPEELKARAAATYAAKKSWATARDLDGDFADFIDRHPTFRREFGFHDESAEVKNPSIHSYRTEEMLGDVSSEWAFLVNWGYKEGLLEAAGYVEGWGPGRDPDALAESDLPEPTSEFGDTGDK